MSPDLDDANLPKPKQEAIDWLIRLRDENISDGEMKAFADWLAEDYRHSEAFAYAEDLFDEMVLAEQAAPMPNQHSIVRAQTTTSDISLCLISNDPNKRIQGKKPVGAKRWMTAIFSIAAVWLFSVNLVVPENSHPFNRFLSDYHTVTGELREIQLSDGSRVLLNTNSAVSVNYDNTTRQIVLHHGQALFTVAKDQRPFEVRTDDVGVRALGTVFEVDRHDPQELSVLVQQHAVRVDLLGRQNNSGGIELQVGQKLRYRHDGLLQDVESTDFNQDSAWQSRRLFINDRPLAELVAELNRYRVGRIFVTDERLDNLRVTGVFSLDKPDDILRSVCDVLDLRETRLSDWWVLLHR
ncbi:FecR domain-containing protein [Methylomonas sp. MgM2]